MRTLPPLSFYSKGFQSYTGEKDLKKSKYGMATVEMCYVLEIELGHSFPVTFEPNVTQGLRDLFFNQRYYY